MDLIPYDFVVILLYIGGIFVYFRQYRDASIEFKGLILLIGLIHLLMSFVYITFTLSNPADAVGYYNQALDMKYPWLSYIGPDTGLIVFFTIPLVQIFGLSYWGSTFVFSFIGLLGIYKLLQVLEAVSSYKWNNWFYLLLLPNLHFWSVGVGKDSIIFYAMCTLLYNIVFKKNFLFYIIPIFLVGFIRIHILFFILAGYAGAIIFVNDRVKARMKVFYILIISLVAYFLIPLVFDRFGIGAVNDVGGVLDKLATTTVEGGSSVNMQGKNIIIKWLSYVFRPIFVDATSALSLFSSFENVAWIYMSLTIARNIKLPFAGFVKMTFWISIFCIFLVTLPSANIMYNLGIAMRQKYMIFPFILYAFFITIFTKKELIKSIAEKAKKTIKK